MIAFRTYNLISCVLFLKMSEDNSFSWFLFKYLRTSNIKIIFIIIIIIIKTITTFSNVIDHHQPDLSTNRTVYMYASCS